jgi:excisionase family DNA binding protein
MSDRSVPIDGDGSRYEPLTALLLTIPEAARALAIGRSTLYELIDCGAVDVVHIGRSTRVPVAAITEYVERLRADGNRSTVHSTRKRPGPSSNSTRASRPPETTRRPTP